MVGEQEPDVGEHFQVRGHGGLTDIYRGDGLLDVHGRAAAREQRDKLDSRRVGKCLEPGGIFNCRRPVQRFGLFIHR